MDASTLYTSARVHIPLAGKLDGALGASVAHFDRYSELDATGIGSQVERHTLLYPNDPDVQAYRQIPEEAFGSEALGRSYGIVFISLADIHHCLTEDKPVITQVVCGSTVFYRAELSSVTRQVTRYDGESENAFSIFALAVLNHLGQLRETRWFGDVTRTARVDVDWARLIRRHDELGIIFTTGGVAYNVREQGQRSMLKLLGVLGAEDDPARRRKLVESRLVQLQVGGAALGERQLPYGYRLARTENGTPARDAQRKLIPVADLAVAGALKAAHTLHADGAPYEAICRRLADLEAEGGIHRRGGQRYRLTFGDALDSPQAATDAAVTLFQAARNTKLPTPAAPTESAIAEYLAGGDPTELFDPMQRLVISRAELLRSSMFYRVLVSDVRGRGRILAGIEAILRWPDDEYGYFAVECPWPWPVDEAGIIVPRFGIDDDILRASAARLLRGLRRTPKRTGGAAHTSKPQRRVLQGFTPWERPADGVEGTLIARHNASDGGANIVLFERPLSRKAGPLPGWSCEIKKPAEYARATIRLRELCGDLAERITAAVTGELLDDQKVAVFERHRPADDTEAIRARLLARAADHDTKAGEADRRAAGARRLAAIQAEQDDLDQAAAYTEDARLAAVDAAGHRKHAARLRDEAEEVDRAPSCNELVEEASLSTTAYLVAGLRRAAGDNGFGPDALGRLADESLTAWNVQVDDENIGNCVRYDVTLNVPLIDGGHLHLPVRGWVSNIRKTATGRVLGAKSPRRGEAARLVFAEGRAVDDVVDRCERDRAGLLRGSLMPWLVEHGVRARGAKCALVDHPHGFVRRILFEDLMGGADRSLAVYPRAYRDHLTATYRDPGLEWGDAACPDDTTAVAQLVATLAAPTRIDEGLTIVEAARLLSASPKRVRGWCTPRQPGTGFARPRYVGYGADKSRVVALRCPHDDCQGTADAVVLLPEVAVSGYGVLCSTCRRAPNMSGVWPKTVFPVEYLQLATSTGEARLRRGARTRLTETPPALNASAGRAA